MLRRFEDNARVCFMGDSITHQNRYLAHIVSYYREHFPEAKVEFYNCGIAGGTLKTMFQTFDIDTINYKPTHVVLMIGVNDSNRDLLNSSVECKYEELKKAYDEYKINLDKFCNMIKEMGIKLTLCTPMPYDEYTKSSEAALPGGSALILGYAEFVKQYAKEHGYEVCDYHSYVTRILQNEVVFDPDHIHPNSRGHYYMAKCFLAFQGLELGDEKEWSSDIQEWHEMVILLRDTFAAEHLLMQSNFKITVEEGVEAAKKYLENIQSGPFVDFFRSLARQYIDDKPKQKEYTKRVIQLMKYI